MGLTHWIIRQAMHRRLKRVEALLRAPGQAQERLLHRLVRRARNTEFGRDHGFAAVRTVRDFQKAVPLARYEDLAPLWHRAFDGGRDVTWPGHIAHFAITSGTTTAEVKSMPVSLEALRANRRAGLTLLALCERHAPDADLLAGKTLYFGGSTRLERHGACWRGDASGINAAHLPKLAWRWRLPEPDVGAMTDWAERADTVCQRYAGSPIRVIAGLPSWTLLLFRRLLDHTGAACVADVWPDLRVLIHFGMAFEPYREQFAELVGRELATVDTYSSSEGGLNAIQSEQGDPSMQLEVDAGAFYEFVPAAAIDAADPPRLTLDEVEVDTDYALLLSTPSGIWAYDVGDVVRFTSVRPPRIVVAGRTRLLLNDMGEHVIQEELEEALTAAVRATGAQVADFTVGAVLPTSSEARGHHRWLIEFHGEIPPLDVFGERLDAALIEANLDYRLHRADDLSLLPPEIVPLAPGTFYAWAERHDALGGQHKVPRVARSRDMVDELIQLSKTL